MRHYFLLLVLLLSIAGISHGQSLTPQVVTSGGGFALVGNNSLSFTVGQPVATLLSSAGGSIGQGFQQAMKVILITAIEPSPVLDVRIFPNPTSAYLQVEGPAAILTLTDVLGRLLWQGRSNGKPLQIDLQGFVDGMYLLKFQTTQANQSTRIVLQH